ncbi:MAG: hypothetical protein AB8B79_14610 [Granulosicoccus sp.]
MAESKLSLLVPGYRVSEQSNPLTTLHWLGEQPHTPWQAHLCQLLGLENQLGETLPAAQFCGYDLDQNRPWVCVAPIHLRADRDTASFIPSNQLALTHAEATELIASVNDFLISDGIEIIRQSDSDWMMAGLDGKDLLSFPPEFLAHRNASTFLPRGDADGQWRRLLTEIQMLLHDHPLNQKREGEGKLSVNSLWFWGGARLPGTEDSGAPASPDGLPGVYADGSFSHLLSEHLGAECRPLSDFKRFLPETNAKVSKERAETALHFPAKTVLLDTSVIDAVLEGADEKVVSDAMQALEEKWLHPLIEQVKSGALSELDVLTEEGQQARCDKAILESMRLEQAAAQPSWWSRLIEPFRR